MAYSQQSPVSVSTPVSNDLKSPSTPASVASILNKFDSNNGAKSVKGFPFEKFIPLSSIPAHYEAKEDSQTIRNTELDANESEIKQETEPKQIRRKDLKNIIIPINNRALELVSNMSNRQSMIDQNTPVSRTDASDTCHSDEAQQLIHVDTPKSKRRTTFRRAHRASSSVQSIQRMRMDLDIGFRSNAEMYRYNYRPMKYAVFSILYLIIPSLLFDEYGPHNSKKMRYLFCIYAVYGLANAVLILYCFIVAVCLQHKKTSIQKEHTLQQISAKSPTDTSIDGKEPSFYRQFSLDVNHKFFCLTRFWYTFAEEFNKVFDIRDNISRIEAKIGPRFSGLVLVFSIFNCTMLFTLIAYKYGTALWSLCPDYNNVKYIQSGQCLIRKIQMWNIVTLSTMSIFVAFSLISQVSEKCQNNKTLALGKILKSFEDRVVLKTLIGEIKVGSDKLIYSLNMSSMKMIIVFNVCLCFGAIVWHFYEFGYNQKYWVNCNRPKSKIFDVYGRCIVFFNSVILLNELQRLMKQYKYILVVMMEFTNASCILYHHHIDDIIGWWQLRRYYRGYEIETFSNVFNTIIAWLLFIAFVFVLYLLVIMFYLDGYTLTADEYVFCVMVFYLIYAVLTMLGIAVSCHKEQKCRHKMMLERAMIALKRKNILLAVEKEKLNKKTVFINQKEIDLMTDIKNDIEHNSLPIEILGLSMSHTTMYLIRGYFGASIGALLIESVLN